MSGHIAQGRNVIAVLVWYFGRSGFSHSDSGAAGFLLEIQAPDGEVIVATDRQWKWMEHPAFSNAGFLRDGYRLSENGIGYDARRNPGPWMEPDFEHPSLAPAVVAEKAHSGPWGRLVSRPIPLFSWGERMPLPELTETELCGGMRLIKGSLPANIQFVPYFRLSAPAGVKVRVWSSTETSLLLVDYTTSEGDQCFESPAWMSGEEICFLTTGESRIHELGYRETGYAASPQGRFDSSDQFFDSLWNKSLRTLHVTMRDTFMDCPCRERAQWPGDFVIQLEQVPYCLDSRAFDLIGKAFLEFVNWQKPDGILFGPLPGNWDKELPAQMLAIVSRFGFWTYYMHTARKREMEAFYAAAKRYMVVWELDENGLLRYREGGWDWLDWGERQDQAPMLTAWFVLALEGCALMARGLEKPDEAERWNILRSKSIQAFRAHYWRPGVGFASPDYAAPADERVQGLAVLSGIATETHGAEMIKVLWEGRACSPYMEKYVLEALFELNRPLLALKRMKERYRGMVEGASSTLHELWPELDSPGSSANHSWSGGPLTLLSAFVAGLRPAEPGWKKVLFRPQPGNLACFHAMVETPAGRVEATYSCESLLKLRFQTPVSATMDLRDISIRPQIRATDGSGITLESTSHVFELPPGDWKFEWTK